MHLSKALAVSSAASKAASKQQQQQQQQQQMQQQHIEYDEDSSTLVETSSSMATSPPMTSNMQRSSSHESHLRSKVGGGEQVVPGTDYNNSSSKQSLSMFDDNGPASRRLSEASEMSSKCASSGQASPNLQSPSHYKVNGIFTNGDDYKSTIFTCFLEMLIEQLLLIIIILYLKTTQSHLINLESIGNFRE